MGTPYIAPNVPNVIKDLNITIQDTSIVLPSQETEKRSMFLSNIDQSLNFNIRAVNFFKPNPDFPPEVVVEKLKSALSKVLVPYDFLAGRLKVNSALGRLEIDCNAAGIGFVVASSELSLEELGDLVYPNPGFPGLVMENAYEFGSEDQPLAIFQVTSFKCNGFAIGLTTNHTTFDGLSIKIFLQNLASLAADKPLVVDPCNNRHLLAARSPPQVTFPHPERLKIKPPTGDEQQDYSKTVFSEYQEDLDIQIFHLSPNDIDRLKTMAKADLTSGNAKVTSFSAVAAHIWRCKALSNNETENNRNRTSTVLYAVDIRSRLEPKLPASYTGNAVLAGYAMAECHVLEEGPFSRLVEMVAEGSARLTNEYVRSSIDWSEVYQGIPNGEFLISSWWRLGWEDVEYPWGKPIYSCPVANHQKNLIFLVPDINGDTNSVNVTVALPATEMKKFQALFHKFLE